MTNRLESGEKEYYDDNALLERLFAFVDVDQQLPILAGYFFQISNFMLHSNQDEILEYIIITKNGDPVMKLLNLLEYDSVSRFLIRVLTSNLEPHKADEASN